MLIKKGRLNGNFTQIENSIIKNTFLSDGAFRLYAFLYSQPNATAITDKGLQSIMKCSQTVITRRKKELKDSNLMVVDYIAPGIYNMFIGTGYCPATVVRDEWERTEKNLKGNDND